MGAEIGDEVVADIFTDIYRQNGWSDPESVSGNGSTLVATKMIREALPDLFERYGIKSLLDIPCGDLNWFYELLKDPLMFLDYIGADIVPELIEANRKKYVAERFEVLDIVWDELPKVDMVMVRDLFGHLPKVDVHFAIENIKRSGSRYLLATTWPNFDDEEPENFVKGAWRHTNLEHDYDLGAPLGYITDGFELEYGGFFDEKKLGLWEVNNKNG